MTQTELNSPRQFLDIPDLSDAVNGNQSTHNRVSEYFYSDSLVRARLIPKMGQLVYRHASGAR